MALDLLSVLDAGETLSRPERALLLAAQAPGVPGPPAEDEPVGATTARLLALHATLAGPALEGTVACSACGATVEFSAVGDDLLAGGVSPGSAGAPDPVEGVRWRPVSYADLVAAARAEDETAGVGVVLKRCVEGPVSPEVRARLVERMAEADPLAEIELDLTCAECGEAVRALLDVLDFTWAQVVAQAQALLADVDTLARAYSWSESEILALPRARRRRFVDLVTGGA